MGPLKRLLVSVVLVGVVVPSAAAAPLRARASFDDATVQFGEPVHARVSVVAGPNVRAGSVRVTDDLAPLTTLALQRTSRAGNVIEATRTATCISASCVAANGLATPTLAPATVTAVLASGRSVQIRVPWPRLTVRGRVTAADLGRAQPPFQASTVPPAPTYRAAPSTLAWLLDGAAIALGLAAAALLVVQARRRSRRRDRGVEGDELGRALRLVREAEARPVPDRRRAAGLLARLLGERDDALAGTASTLAWAEQQPDPAALESLAGDVEREKA